MTLAHKRAKSSLNLKSQCIYKLFQAFSVGIRFIINDTIIIRKLDEKALWSAVDYRVQEKKL